MKRIHCLLIVSFSIIFPFFALAQTPRTLPFDSDWRFEKGDHQGAEDLTYIDNRWRKLDLPHDWSIEDLANPHPDSISGPFTKGSIGGTATGFTLGGTGWYRKKFSTPKAASTKKISIHFDGVYMNSDVWLNGHHLGNHPYGYTPFYYDLTPYLKPAGEANILAVRVRNEGKNSRWYSGSGIYRHVWLTVTDPIHVAPWGVAISTPEVADSKASVVVKTTLTNGMTSGRTVSVATTLLSPEGKSVGSSQQNVTIPTKGQHESIQSLSVSRPSLWSMKTPQLYKTITEIKEGGRVLDRVETSFGIRSLEVDAQHGLRINGQKIL